MKIKLSILLFFLSTTITFAQFKKGDFVINGNDLPYRVLYPNNYDEAKQYPLIVFLHGSGECGSDNEKQLVHGGDFFLQNIAKYPAIVIFPQCPSASSWTNMQCNNMGDDKGGHFSFAVSDKETSAMETLRALINDWMASGRINTRKVYIGGLSLGGIGTYEILSRMPNTFAAAFVMCGAGNPAKASLYAHTPMWIFQGEDDNVVPIHYSKEMLAALKDNGCKVKYTSYPGVGHNCWDSTFQNTELLPWLFDQTK